MTEEYADDHVPQNTRPPLQLSTVFVRGGLLPEPVVPAPDRSDILAVAIASMRLTPKRERFAKAVKLENYALAMERFAQEGDEERAALWLAAAELRELAEALKE